MKAALAILLALALFPAHAAPLPVSALIAGDGLRVSWAPVPGAAVVCVTRPGGVALIGCGASPWRQGSVDARLQVRPGDPIEVRAWDASGRVLAVGATLARQATYLPSTATPRR